MRHYKQKHIAKRITLSIKTTLSTALFLLMSAQAMAHVSFIDAKPLKIGKSFKASFAIPHGCNGTATQRVTVKIPTGVIGVKAMPKSTWKVSYQNTQYPTPYQQYAKDVTSGVSSITWQGNLADADYDEFTFIGYLAKSDVDTLYFPVIQECEQGQYLWTDTSGKHIHGHSAAEQSAPALKLDLNQQ